MIECRCKSCGALIRGPEQLLGKELKCPKCKAAVVLRASTGSAAKTDKAPAKAEKPPARGDDDDDVSAKDLLAEISGKPSSAAAPPAPGKVATLKSAPAGAPTPPKHPAPAIAVPPPERGLPINLIVSVVGILAVVITAYVIYQKDQASKEEAHTRQVVKKLTAEFDAVRTAIKGAKELGGGAGHSKAKEALEDARSEVGRLKRNIDLELGSISTDFSKGQRSSLDEEADKVKGEIDDALAAIEQDIQDAKEMLAFVAARNEEMADVEKSVKNGQRQIKDMDYVSAKRTLTRAKSDIDEIAEEIEDKKSDAKGEASRKQIEECKVAAGKHLETIRKLLQSDEIVHGSRGLVKYKDKWVTPEEKRAAEAAKKQAAAPLTATAKGPAKEFKPDEIEWLLDDMSGPLQWTRLGWADEAEVSIQDVNGNKALCVKYATGAQSKVAISRGGKLDLSSRGMLVMNVDNQGAQPVNLCLAVWTDRMYESQAQSIKPGPNRGVSFSLVGPCYKCDKDNWQNYTFQIDNPAAAGQIILMIYPSSEGTMFIDDVRLITK